MLKNRSSQPVGWNFLDEPFSSHHSDKYTLSQIDLKTCSGTCSLFTLKFILTLTDGKNKKKDLVFIQHNAFKTHWKKLWRSFQETFYHSTQVHDNVVILRKWRCLTANMQNRCAHWHKQMSELCIWFSEALRLGHASVSHFWSLGNGAHPPFCKLFQLTLLASKSRNN